MLGKLAASEHDAETGDWIKSDPAAAAEVLLALPPVLRERALNSVLRSVAKEDVEGVMAMVAYLPDEGGADPKAISTAAMRYREWFPELAADWLISLRNGPIRDSAIQGFVSGDLTESDPEAAASWAAAVSDPGLRGSLLESTVNVWKFFKPAEARRWIESTTRLSTTDRARLLSKD